MKGQQLKTVKIKTFTEMLEFINSTDLDSGELKILLEKAYGIYITGNEGKQAVIDSLQAYFNKYTGEGEKPLFLD